MWPLMGSVVMIALPNPVFDLQGAVDEAVRAGTHRLVLPRGVLRLDSAAEYALEVENLRNFTLEGQGTTFVLERSGQGFAKFTGCEGTTLKGFAVEHRVPPMTQGWIRSVSADRSTYEVELMPGYLSGEDEIPLRPVGYVFDPATLNWREGSIDLYFERVARLGGRRLRLDVGRPMDHAVKVGDLMAFRGKWLTQILFSECARTRVDGVTVRSSGGFALHEAGGDGGSFYRYRVERGPTPPGAPMAPLLSSSADAFHSSGVRRGPQVVGCHFEYMADDGVPIHGNYVGVAAAEGRRLVATTPWVAEWFRVGDRVRIYDPELSRLLTQEPLPRVLAVRRLPDAEPSTSAHRVLVGKPFRYEVQLDRDVAGVGFDALIANAECQGDGFVVRGNTIRNHRARGMLITASEGVIEDNVIDGSTIAGIVLSPERYWLQSDYSRSVVIRRNTIRNVSRATVGPWSNQVGGVVVAAEVPRGRLHRDIRIEDNLFEGIFGPAIVVRHATDVTVARNRFRNLRPVVNRAGADHGIPAESTLFVDDALVNP